ncbi:type VI secretion system Vgr family protein [Acinetobacter populi]|uniref:Type IV secretion protein Rhs n=1 Tax=Acinetobacter populi TaxID=1582270 RepID=A0A1Z9Z1B1_9GAMM|nr:type VI secretion system Vgr family protein [Acinetobacter populi]OUY08271.1 hypothetical protein CAP51_01220 [Acinetobacter populi]
MHHQIQLYGTALPESDYGTPYFWFDTLSGHEKINALFEYQLIVKVRDQYFNPAHGYRGLEGYVSPQEAATGGSPASHLNLQSLIGTEVGIQMRLDGLIPLLNGLGGNLQATTEQTSQNQLSGTRYYRGLVNRVEALSVRNRHALYKITLVPWLWLLTKRTDFKIYQNKNVLHIIEEVLQRYPYPVDYRCHADYAALDFQVQYGETDYDFIVRLMQEHGINYHFEHSRNHLTLVLSDHNAAYKEMEAKGYRQLSIYPPNQRFPEQAEYIEQFEPAQQLVSGIVSLSDYQFKQPQLVQTASSQYLWEHRHAEQEIYEWQQGDFVDGEAGQIKATTLSESHYQQGYRALGKGRLKGLQTGYKFTLNNHPNTASNRGWLVLGTQTLIRDISEEKADNQFYDAQVEFLVQPEDQILRPDRTFEKPHGRPQTATVVGPEGEEIYTDQYGRVKVKFHWDRYGQEAEQGINTCWLRVSTGWAGNNYGTIHLPRIGQEVIVDFFNGDPDMPFVAGRLTNPEQMPLWELPSQKALSGIKSKELEGQQSNQLVMDDTPEQVQIHLRSDHQASELNLGYITRIADVSGRTDYRGEGFELRTDGHGVVRAEKGLILTSYGKPNAESYVKDIAAITGQLYSAVEQHKTQTEVAIRQKADDRTIELTAQTELKVQVEEIEGKTGEGDYKELSSAHVVIGTPSGVGIVAGQSIHLTSEEQIALSSGEDVSLAVGGRLFASSYSGISLFTQQGGARLFSGQDKVEIQAQDGALEMLARMGIQIISTEQGINITAKNGIKLNGGGSQVEINNGVTFTTSGKFEVKASEHKFLGPQNVGVNINNLPALEVFNEQFEMKLPSGEPLSFIDYKISSAENGFIAQSNEIGKTQVVHSKQEEELKLDLLWMNLDFSEDAESAIDINNKGED